MDGTRPARTRFAPSPTGYVHIGSLRTTLFSWLWARHTGGQFLLRIEDTDRKRYVEDAEDQLKQSLRALDLQWDEGPDVGGPFAPYHQSERLPIYHRYADELLAKGQLYKCWCSPERLQSVREAKQARKEPPGYDRHCRFLSDAERAELDSSDKPYVMRLAVPLEGETVVNDLLRGPITFQNALQDDAVMIKSDGFPTYHFAVVVDDHEMEITHVLRADEWIATSPLHVLLYTYFGWQQPVWVHVPNVLGADGRKKLSKRDGDVSVSEYLDKGYLPEALTNFLALIGWGYDETTEIMTRDELVARFDLHRISKSGGVFNPEKLDRFNGIYIRMLTPVQLTERLLPWLERDGLLGTPATPAEIERVTELVPLIQERLVVLSEAPELLRFFFDAPESYEPELLIPKKSDAATARRTLEAAAVLRELPEWEAPALEARLRALADELGLKAGDLFMPLRVAATGSRISPPLFETLHALGRDETLARFERAAAALDAHQTA